MAVTDVVCLTVPSGTTNDIDLRVADGTGITVSPVPVEIDQPAGASSFLFQPGGVAGGNVFTDWPSLYAAVNAVEGLRWVAVDDSIANAVVPAGAYNLAGWILLGSPQPSVRTGDFVVLTFQTGATITQCWAMVGLWLGIASTSTAPVLAATVARETVYLDQNASLYCEAGAAPFIHCTDVTTVSIYLGAGVSIGDGTNAVLEVDTGVHAFIELPTIAAGISANALTGTGEVDTFGDPGAQISTTQPGLTGELRIFNTQTYQSAGFAGAPYYSFVESRTSGMYYDTTTGNIGFSPAVLYTTTTPASWAGTPPTSVGAALDRIASAVAALRGSPIP